MDVTEFNKLLHDIDSGKVGKYEAPNTDAPVIGGQVLAYVGGPSKLSIRDIPLDRVIDSQFDMGYKITLSNKTEPYPTKPSDCDIPEHICVEKSKFFMAKYGMGPLHY